MGARNLSVETKVYLSGGRPLFVLSDAQQEEVIAQADSHLRTAKGRGYRRQVTRAEVSDLLSGLPRDAAGLASFHDAQKLILGYREKQIARFRVIFPDTVTKSGKTPPSRRRVTSSAGGDSGGGSGGDGTMIPAGGSGSSAGGSVCSKSKENSVGRSRDAGAGSGKAASRSRGDKFSADVAPPEMFVKDVGFTPAGMAKHVSDVFFWLRLGKKVNAARTISLVELRATPRLCRRKRNNIVSFRFFIVNTRGSIL